MIDRTVELCDKLVRINQKHELLFSDIEEMDECLMELFNLQNALASILNIEEVVDESN